MREEEPEQPRQLRERERSVREDEPAQARQLRGSETAAKILPEHRVSFMPRLEKGAIGSGVNVCVCPSNVCVPVCPCARLMCVCARLMPVSFMPRLGKGVCVCARAPSAAASLWTAVSPYPGVAVGRSRAARS